MKRYKVRFHLARGQNFMKWQVFDLLDNTKDYYDPSEYSLLMKGCVLGNHPATAQKIYEGEHKTVCAWISCDRVTPVMQIGSLANKQRYMYNPQKNPHWFTELQRNVDGKKLPTMVTINRRVYG